MKSENLRSVVDMRLMIRGNDTMTTQLTHCTGTDELGNGRECPDTETRVSRTPPGI